MLDGKTLLLYSCLVKEESDGDELAFVLCRKCAAPSDETNEAVKSVSVQWATSGSEKEENDVERGEAKKLVAAVDCREVIPVQSIVSTAYAVRAVIAVHSFTPSFLGVIIAFTPLGFFGSLQ